VTDAPKSSFDLVMERLRKKDAEAGIQEKPLTDAQRAAIADARSACEARIAERKIMHQSTVAGLFEPAERDERDAELRRDLDEKIKRIREAGH
jgi:predicted outer membrane protein